MAGLGFRTPVKKESPIELMGLSLEDYLCGNQVYRGCNRL